MRIMVAIGTRPEAIKLAPVIIELQRAVDLIVVTTGQHPDLAGSALEQFGLVPTIQLPRLPEGRTLSGMTSLLLSSFDGLIEEAAPDWMIVQGDTTSAFAAALAAFHRRVRIAHVEAGLRTHDLDDPFPEEANRVLIAHLATLHFAPTKLAACNLAAENVQQDAVMVVGNTIVDAVRILRETGSSARSAALVAALDIDVTRPLILVTCHRRENQGETLVSICSAIDDLAQRYPQHQFLFPMHPNPAMRKVITAQLNRVNNVTLRNPLTYEEVLAVIDRSSLILTDSGGLQEEAAAFGKPVVILRTRTERPEILEAGLGVLAGHEGASIVASTCPILDAGDAWHTRRGENPFGDGHAARRIADRLIGGGMSR